MLFSGNSAQHGGGAIFNVSGDQGTSNPIFTNVTFSGNYSRDCGGAIFNRSKFESNPQLQNSVLWNNMSLTHQGTVSSTICHIFSARTYVINSLVQGTGGSGSWISDTNFVDGGNNIDSNPNFITPVDPSSAPTTAGNLRLTKGSPAIDSGKNAYVDGVPTDLDGKARKVDGDGNGTKTVDMGAYEFVPTIKEPEYKINLPFVKR